MITRQALHLGIRYQCRHYL